VHGIIRVPLFFDHLLEFGVCGLDGSVLFKDSAGCAEPSAVRKIPSGNSLDKGMCKEYFVDLSPLPALSLLSLGS
jgi:hypothetical protein